MPKSLCSRPSLIMPLGDLDDLLAYSTVKMVKVRDRWLGIIHLLTQLAM